LDREPGIVNLAFDLLHGKLSVEYDSGAQDPARIRKAVASTGLKCEAWSDDRVPTFLERNGRILLASLSGVSLLGAMLWQGITSGQLLASLFAHEHAGHHVSLPVLALCLIAISAGSVFVAPKAFHAFRSMQPDMNALVMISILGAMYLGEWIEGSTLAFLFALAALLESYSIGRARNAVEALMQVTPGHASVVHGDHEHRMPVAEVKVGSVVRVRPGERIPCDGEVSFGQSDVSQAMITGEAAPVFKTAGDAVFAGTMNGNGTIEIRTSRPASDSTLARIVRIVEGVQHRRAPSEQFVERFSRYYTPLMMLLAAVVAVVPPLFGGRDWGQWFYQGMVILLISCPCALVISTPVSIVAALASAARHGVLIKGGAFLEEAARLKAVAFDKTGVLTAGEPEVQSIYPLNGYSPEQILKRLAAVEFRSQHPLARAVLRYAAERGIKPAEVRAFHALQGRGAEAEIDGVNFWAGSLRFMAEKRLDTHALQPLLAQMRDDEGTVVACGTDKEAWAMIRLADPVRAEAKSAIESIRAEGITRVIMLTGDNATTARTVAAHVGVDEVQAELLPDDKAAAIRDLIKAHGKVAMVGDGINDAQAMASASVGVALGGAGIDVVLETADVVLMSGGLSKLAFLLRHARRAAGVIQQNVALALLMKFAFLLLAFFGVATLWMAVAADMGATLLVTFNGLRLLRVREP
jgi:Cd2+/Zn2+-exporting ATPase